VVEPSSYHPKAVVLSLAADSGIERRKMILKFVLSELSLDFSSLLLILQTV
jgi:hypothetical protein